MFDSKLGIIGVGVMGQGILSCAIEKGYLSPKEVALFDVCQEKLESYKKEYIVCSSTQELIDRSEYVLISIKPQHFDSLASSVKFNDNNTIISIMAGKNIESIRNKTGFTNGTARVMPNTPCKIGQGVCAVCFDNVSDNDKKEFILSLLKTCGEVVQIEEKYFDCVTSVSGSGPAYVYMFLEGMIKGGMNGGLDYEKSKKLAINTMIGAAMLAEKSSEPLEELIEKVCSKGGTTIQAVNVYREKGLEEIIQEGIDACKKRSEEMGKAQ